MMFKKIPIRGRILALLTLGSLVVGLDRSGLAPAVAGLRDALLKRRDLFVENFIERLLTYSLGRGVEEYDRPIIRKIARETAPDDYRWSSIILSIVKTKPFQMIQSRGA